MTKSKLSIIIMFMILCFSTTFAQGQPQTQSQEQTEAQQLYQEYAQLNQQLQQLQQQAMQDESISKKGEALDKKVRDAMIANNPDIKSTLDKRDEIMAKYQEAQQAGDQETLMQLSQSFQSISKTIQAEQQKVMQQPELQSELQDFQTILKAKMEEINPNTSQIISRLQELQAKLMSIQQGQN